MTLYESIKMTRTSWKTEKTLIQKHSYVQLDKITIKYFHNCYSSTKTQVTAAAIELAMIQMWKRGKGTISLSPYMAVTHKTSNHLKCNNAFTCCSTEKYIGKELKVPHYHLTNSYGHWLTKYDFQFLLIFMHKAQLCLCSFTSNIQSFFFFFAHFSCTESLPTLVRLYFPLKVINIHYFPHCQCEYVLR